jgi:hypothetical protein
MPSHDPLTAIREANDLEPEIAIEAAWSIIAKRDWIPTPQLLFALKAFIIESHPELKDNNNGS